MSDLVPEDWQWLTHPDIAPLAQRFHLGAVGYWTGRGWEPCDEPDEFDRSVAEQPAALPPAPDAAESAAPEAAEPVVIKTKKSGSPEGSD